MPLPLPFTKQRSEMSVLNPVTVGSFKEKLPVLCYLCRQYVSWPLRQWYKQ